MGLAAGFLEPLESTSIHLIQSALTRFLAMWPQGKASAAIVAGFNRRSAAEAELIRDFLILHYKANQRVGQPFWDRCRTAPVPDSLSSRIEEFRAACHIDPAPDELFGEAAWLQVMAGQGIEPQAWNPMAARVPAQDLGVFLRAVAADCIETVRPMPRHMDFLAAACAMPAESESA